MPFDPVPGSQAASFTVTTWDPERCNPAPWWTLLELPSLVPQERAWVPHYPALHPREDNWLGWTLKP